MEQKQGEELLQRALEILGYSPEQGALRIAGKVTVLRITGDRLTLFTQLADEGDPQARAVQCNRVNRELGEGCLVADERGRIFLKASAHLIDALLATEVVKSALNRQAELIRSCARKL